MRVVTQDGKRTMALRCVCGAPLRKRKVDVMTAKDCAKRINHYLVKFEHDKNINVCPHDRLHDRFLPYHDAAAFAKGQYVYVRYLSFQAAWPLLLAEAEKYLAWLEAGNVGTHDQARMAKKVEKA